MGDDEIELCCLLWARDGESDGLHAYEDAVLALLDEHGGRLVQRAIGDGADGAPVETQLFRFRDRAALDGFLRDPRRQAMTDERDRVIERTQLFPVHIAR